MATSHFTVPYSLALDMQFCGKLLGSVGTIIYGVDLHWHSCTHGLPLKLELGHHGLFCCELYLMIHSDLDRGCIIEESDSLVDLRGAFGSSVPKHYLWNS